MKVRSIIGSFAITCIIGGWIVAGIGTSKPSVAEIAVDFCRIQARDAPYQVPVAGNALGQSVNSGNGFYGYGRTCPYFIIDIEMTPKSHCFQDPKTAQWKCFPILVSLGAYDLPSSQSFGGTIPVVQEDCQRWTTLRRFYTPAGTVAGSYDSAGNWSSGGCVDYQKSATGAAYPFELNAPVTCCETHRFLVSTKLRTSYQEVFVTFSEKPPS
jgi:hypothetical protein